ncbi:MAG: heme o synthase [Alphaproteobacteria bacterium]|nr:heme o synthase [Alphaproteobacteria bacterium]MDE2494468.1 heme o synthase [Alphaproteobacteria bacterium]
MADVATLAFVRPAATVGDYFALLKPRVMSLVVFTGLAGIVVAPGHVHPLVAFSALLCIAVAAGASGALNMAYDSDIDALMSRTAGRPIPMGRIAREDALAFGWTLAVGAVTLMELFVNDSAAALLAFTIFFYVGVYTLWLKRRTPQNIVIGGLAGALPPAIGWAAVTGTLSLQPLLLVAIIFLWTPPHFWALSLFRSEDYARAGVPMLPVVRGKRSTRRHILVYALILAPLGVVPAVIGMAGPLYLTAAAGLGGLLLWRAVRTLHETDETREPAARRLFAVSIFYLFSLFAALLAEHLVGIVPLHVWM